MAYKIKGVLKVSTSLKMNNNHVGVRVKFKSFETLYSADTNGNLSVPDIMVKPTVDSMFKNRPVSRFGDMSGSALQVNLVVGTSRFTLTTMNPLFMAGQYFEIPPTTLDVATVITGAGTVYMYVQLESGVPKYTLSASEIADSLTLMFIGTLTTNASTVIANHNLQKISRFEEFRPNLSQRGGSFPVSSGSPTTPGTITW